MFGSTSLTTLVEPSRVFDFTTLDQPTVYAVKYLSDYADSDRGVFGWCVWGPGTGKNSPTDMSDMDLCVEPNFSDTGTLY